MYKNTIYFVSSCWTCQLCAVLCRCFLAVEGQSLLSMEQVVRDSWGKGISFTVFPDRAFLCLQFLNLSAGMGGTCALGRSLLALQGVPSLQPCIAGSQVTLHYPGGGMTISFY